MQNKQIKTLGILGAAAVATLAMNERAIGQVSYSAAGTNYNQNFDNLYTIVPANNTTVSASGTLPTGWQFVESGANANTTLRNDNGSSGTGDTYLYGATSSNERAFGGFSSGSLTTIFGVAIVNNTGATLTQFTLTFDAEQWKDGGSSAAVINVDAFSYGLGNAAINSGSFTANTSLDASAKVNNTSSDVTLDGNAAANRTAGVTATITGLNWTAGQVLWLRWSDANDAGNDDGLAIDNVVFTASANLPANAVWATASGVWDTSTGNWTGGSPTANKFKDNDTARFDNTSTGGTITIASGGVLPTVTTVDNDASHPYTFTSSGSTGIASGMLVKTGAGTLTLQNQNTYTGGTSVNGGTLIFSNDNQLGASGGINMGGGELKTAAAITSSRTVSLAASTGSTINTNGFASSIGSISGTGSLTVNGGGTLTTTGISGASNIAIGASTGLTATAAYTQSTGTISVAANGSLTFDYAGTGRTTILGGTVNGALAFKTGTPRVDFNTGTVSGSGELQIYQSGTLISNTSGQAAGTVGINVHLNPSNTASFVASIGGTNIATHGDTMLAINGDIFGASDVNFANNSTTGGGSGNILLGAQSHYTGATFINMNDATLKLGTDNALPVGTDVTFGTMSSVGSPVLDLNGHSQQIGSLSHGSQGTQSNFKIVNNGSSDAVLTVNGSTTPTSSFGGVIADGTTNKISLVKSGINTLSLSGTNTYTGVTSMQDGRLRITPNGSINRTASVDVTAGVLELDNTSSVNDFAIVSFADGATADLEFTGTETIGTLKLGALTFTSGTYDATSNPDFIAGTGSFTVTGAVPEPTSLGVLAIGGFGLLARRRRRA